MENAQSMNNVIGFIDGNLIGIEKPCDETAKISL